MTSIPFTIAEFRYGSGILPDRRGWAILLYVVDLSVDPGADLLHPRRRIDRRQPRRTVHQPCADLRHAALHPAARRGFPRLPRPRAGAGLRRHLAGGAQRAGRSAGSKPRPKAAPHAPATSKCSGFAETIALVRPHLRPARLPGTARRDRAARWRRRPARSRPRWKLAMLTPFVAEQRAEQADDAGLVARW